MWTIVGPKVVVGSHYFLSFAGAACPKHIDLLWLDCSFSSQGLPIQIFIAVSASLVLEQQHSYSEEFPYNISIFLCI